MTGYLTRARLREDRGLAALGPVLVPDDPNDRVGVSHRLVWTLFGDAPDAKRDFLWREEKPGRFLVLSAREPDAGDLWSMEVRPFAPSIEPGERLHFRLRVNAAVSRNRSDTGAGGSSRPKVRRDDVVMDAIRDLPKGERAIPRARELGWIEDEDGERIAPGAPREWLVHQGERHGFTVEELLVLAYEQVRIPRDAATRRRRNDVRFSVLELEGALTVREPEIFLDKVRTGFGRAKAFGCGLMLIKRAPSTR